MRAIERLLRGRRHRRGRVSDQEAELLAAAIELRAARPGADVPREEFVAGLRRRIAEAAEPGDEPSRPRRRLLIGASVAAASAATAAVAAERTLPGADPAAGVWHPVLTAAELRAGQVRRFEAGTANGFVLRRRDGTLTAVSGNCTHLGCRLSLNTGASRLDCPCHSTSFAVTGELVQHQLAVAPAPLPRFQIREHRGHVEIYLPL